MNDCRVWKKLEETKSKHQRLQLNQRTQKLLKRDADPPMPTVLLYHVAEWQEQRLLASSSPRDTRMLSCLFHGKGIFNHQCCGRRAKAHIKLTFSDDLNSSLLEEKHAPAISGFQTSQ